MLRVFLFYNKTIAIAMTNIHPFTTTAACILTAAAALFTSSCQPTSPKSYAHQFETASTVAVHGYNGKETLHSRVFADFGAIPANARRAMTDYIKGAEWKKADYIRPQYFVQVDKAFWALCIDNDGNLVGIIPFRDNKDMRKISVNNHFKMLVNTTDQGPALGYAILKNLAYADGLRVSTRKAEGLTTPIPAPPSIKVVVPPKDTKPATAGAPAAPAPKADTDTAAEETPADDATETPADDTATEETPAADGDAADTTEEAAADVF